MVNLANALTALRLLLAVVFFVLIGVATAATCAAALVVFLAAAITDLLDGYLARKYNCVTDLGRIADPFVDKVLICGALIMFLQNERLTQEVGVRSWMVVVIVAREFFVNSLRGFVESKGINFSATKYGKGKMTVQSAAVCGSLIYLSLSTPPSWGPGVVFGLYIAAVAVTFLSGLVYLYRALKGGILGVESGEAGS